MPDQMWERAKKILFADLYFAMLRFDVVGHHAGKRQLAVSLLAVADRKSFDRLAANLRHKGCNGAGVEAAAQKNSQRHVAHQMAVDRAFQQFAVSLNVMTLVLRFVRGRNVQIPVLPDLGPPIQADFHRVPRRSLGKPVLAGMAAGRKPKSREFGKLAAV